ncbi:unnamed protein product [Colias eurytheme]|nr:unnamed protein product [Colias eurytheme]
MSSEVDSNGNDSAFLSRGWQQRNKKYSNTTETSATPPSKSVKTKTIRCYKCKKIGHYKNQCKLDKTKESAVFSVYFMNSSYKNTDWYIDSGASVHMITDEKRLQDVSYNNAIKNIVVANKTTVPVLCSGNTQITTVVDGSEFNITVKNVLCIPKLTTNLLSVSELIRNGNLVIFQGDICKILNHNKVVVAIARLVNGVYRLDTKQDCLLAGKAETATSMLWHRRLGHINSKDLNSMKNGAVEGVSFPEKAEIDKSQCITCCEGKLARLPFTHSGSRCDSVLEVVHADVCGPMETISEGKSRYFLLFVDDYSRMAFVYFLKAKNEAFKYFKVYKALVEKQTQKSIKILRTDNGGEFCSTEFESFLDKEGIVHQKTNPHTPEQNGLCERLNRTVVERARCLLFDAKMEKKFWAEAVNTAVYLRNRTLASGLQKTPYELWCGRKPNLDHIRVFGSPAMVHVPKINRTKWDKKAEKYILLGFAENTKGYRLYNPRTKKITTSRDVIIMETSRKQDTVDALVEEKKEEEDSQSEIDDNSSSTTSLETIVDPMDTTYVPDHTLDSSTSEEFCDSLSNEETFEAERSNTERRSQRERKPTVRYGYSNACVTECLDMHDDSLTYEEAMSGPEKEEWCKAMKEELQSFDDNKAWTFVDRSEADRIVQCKWVFKRKYKSDNSVRYRARLVAKGFTQREGVDYYETYSPVLRYSTLRLLFALSVKLNFQITHLDVITAFLNGYLHENVYMQAPPNLDCKENCVLKLNRAIYGLKQSARAWNDRINDCLLKLNFVKSKLEPCLYTKKCKKEQVIVAIFVDDFFIFSNSSNMVKELKTNLMSKFKIKDLGQVKQCLGMRVKMYENGCISLDQEKFVDHILSKFNMTNCKVVDTPIEGNLKLEKSVEICKQYPYQQLIGSLMYLSVLTRPDISYSVSYLSQFNNCYSYTHWKHAKRILRYLCKTKSYGLMFSKDNCRLEGFVDADWASNTLDRKSYTGFYFKFSGTVISYECKKQCTVALSSTEAEYMAIAEACKEAIYLRNLFSEIIVNGFDYVITLYNDNQGAQKLTENPLFHKRTKHIDVRHHFVREAVAGNLIKIVYIPTSEMPADLLTKGLNRIKHNYFIKKLGIQSIV